jgi:hypothetical protein
MPSWVAEWEPTSGFGANSYNWLLDITGTDDTAWAVGKFGSNPAQIATSSPGPGWSTTPYPGPPYPTMWLYGVHAVANDTVWAVGAEPWRGYTLTHAILWDGTYWTKHITPNRFDGDNELHAVSGIHPGDVWAVGMARNAKFASIGALTPGVAGLTFSNDWIALAQHWDGTEWTAFDPVVPGERSPLYDVVTLSDGQVWAVGTYSDSNFSTDSQPLILREVGGAWEQVWERADIGSAGLMAVSGAPGDIWAVGQCDGQPLTVHIDGYSIERVPVPAIDAHGSILRGVYRESPTSVWAVGAKWVDSPEYANWWVSQALSLHWNGSVWTEVPCPVPGVVSHLTAVSPGPDGLLRACGWFQLSQNYTVAVGTEWPWVLRLEP